MTETFNSNPDFVIAESPNKPKHKSTPKGYRNHTCGKCDSVVNKPGPRIVITTFDHNNTKATTYYHEKCSPLKSAGTFGKMKGLFGL